MAGGGGVGRRGSPPPGRLTLLMAVACAFAAAAVDAKVVHVEEHHRRSMLANGLGSAPPMGWNSWNHFQCQGNGEDVIRETADALVSTGLAALGYKYVNIDDCWAEPERDAMGNLVANKKTFPHGIKALADYVHSKGLKLGIYSDAGYKTCAKAQPGSLGYEEQDAKTFASWVSNVICRSISACVSGSVHCICPVVAGSGLPQVRQLQQRRPEAAEEVPQDEQGPDEDQPADLLLALRMGRHAPGAVGSGLRQQLEDHQRHRRHLGQHDRDGGPERGVGGVRAPRWLERSGHAGGGQRGHDEQRVHRALQPLGDLKGAAHHRLRRAAHVAGDVRHRGQQGGDRRQPRSARRAGEEGEDGGEQRGLGGAAVGVPDGGGGAEPARDGRGHDHRALGRHRHPRRHHRRGQGPVAAQDGGGQIHGQDGRRRGAALVQDVRAQAQLRLAGQVRGASRVAAASIGTGRLVCADMILARNCIRLGINNVPDVSDCFLFPSPGTIYVFFSFICFTRRQQTRSRRRDHFILFLTKSRRRDHELSSRCR